MSLLRRLFGAGAYVDEPAADQERDARAVLEGLGVELLDPCDAVPGGVGQFGYSPLNPIPVNGPIGEIVYLNTLRTPGGVAFFFHRLGSTQHEGYPRPVDVYEGVSCDGAVWASLFFDMYFLRRSRLAPDGLRRERWDRLQEPFRSLIRFPIQGTNARVEDFPFGLPAALRSLNEGPWSGGCALAIERMLARDPERFRRPAGYVPGEPR